MWGWIQQLDRLLRGEATTLPELRSGKLNIPVFGISFVILLLGMIYGICMGVFAKAGSGNGAYMQIIASMVKVPALFFLTLIVTMPSLYVFNALVGSRLTFPAVLRLLVGSTGVILAVLSSLGPIIAFFSISTTSYTFILLLNVIIFSIAGFLGLGFLLQTLHRITVAQANEPPPLPTEPVVADPNNPNFTGALPEQPSVLDRVHPHIITPKVSLIFRIWMIVFALVGGQMSWILRPFIGRPDRPFTWFRDKESNFFEALWHILIGMLGAGGDGRGGWN